MLLLPERLAALTTGEMRRFDAERRLLRTRGRDLVDKTGRGSRISLLVVASAQGMHEVAEVAASPRNDLERALPSRQSGS